MSKQSSSSNLWVSEESIFAGRDVLVLGLLRSAQCVSEDFSVTFAYPAAAVVLLLEI